MADAASWVSIGNFVFLFAGVGLGVGGGYLGFPAIKEARRLREELERNRREQQEYRTSVNSHFRKTAELVTEMTRSYAAVYDHLSSGARNFCDTAGAAEVPFSPLPGTLGAPVIEAESARAAGIHAAPGTDACNAQPGSSDDAGQPAPAATSEAAGEPPHPLAMAS
ncbi:MAG TPA: DUF1043 family protein [Candidatus Binatia bacterium]|jgi:uncharacterized membrane-anchored protein YhcB (DUF1043 family)